MHLPSILPKVAIDGQNVKAGIWKESELRSERWRSGGDTSVPYFPVKDKVIIFMTLHKKTSQTQPLHGLPRQEQHIDGANAKCIRVELKPQSVKRNVD